MQGPDGRTAPRKNPARTEAKKQLKEYEHLTVKVALHGHLLRSELDAAIQDRAERNQLLHRDTFALFGMYCRLQREAGAPIMEESQRGRGEQTFFRSFAAAVALGTRACPGWLEPAYTQYMYAL